MTEENRLFDGRTEAADRVEFDVIHRGLVRLDVTDRDGKTVFHLHRKTQVVCRRCKAVYDDELRNSCSKCGANGDLRNPEPDLVVNRPVYTGPWGPSIGNWLKTVLEGIFREGRLEWVPELDSWFFTPAGPVLDRDYAARKVLENLAL